MAINHAGETRHKTRVAFFFGGRSTEHEISVITALQAVQAIDPRKYEVIPVYIDPQGRWFTGERLLDRSVYRRFSSIQPTLTEVYISPVPQRYPTLLAKRSACCTWPRAIEFDVAFPAFHGRYGEDGCIQGLFEVANVPYTGCPLLSAAVAMSKSHCKRMLQSAGIPVLPDCLIDKQAVHRDASEAINCIRKTAGLSDYPLFVKPNNLGSSVGIGRATDDTTLIAGLSGVFLYDNQAIIEPCAQSMLEINCSVRGTPSGPQASVVEIPLSSSGMLTYEEKYLRGGGKKTGQSQGMQSLDRVIDPPTLPAAIKERVIEYAKMAFSILGCRGIVRFDFMYHTDRDEVTFNELNTLPGSCAFYLWVKSTPQVLYTELIDQAIQEALRTAELNLSLKSSIGLRALA